MTIHPVEILLIKLTKGDKNHVKALIHCFFNYSHELYGEKKHGQAKKYADLYLKSFDVFNSVDYTNFSDNLALDYSKDIKDYGIINESGFYKSDKILRLHGHLL